MVLYKCPRCLEEEGPRDAVVPWPKCAQCGTEKRPSFAGMPGKPFSFLENSARIYSQARPIGWRD